MTFKSPPAMAPGDSVAVIAPSSGGARNAPHVLELALERLRTVFDLDPIVYPTARQGDAFLAANPRARAADVHAAFKDPDITGVFATIGGWEQLRILKHLYPAVLSEHPTRFFGMSDNTNLSLALWNCGIVSYNGAQLMNEIAVPGELPAYTERYCRRAFFEDSLGELTPSSEWTDEPAPWDDPDAFESPPSYEPNPGWRWAGGETPTTGRLWGGCRAVLEWQLATDQYLPEPDALAGAVLAIEIAEDLPEPETIAGTLLCLGERGLLERFEAVIVGRAPGRSFLTEPPRDERDAYRNQVYDAVIKQVKRYNAAAPIVCGIDWGHTTPTAPLPIGDTIAVDPERETITFGSNRPRS
ncbi:S66 family peptidase [Halocatena pleomorpha]|uniref:LD-carboxypeptidase n=1 Tax=Halocatena pleomorpha TaxID=1785090 RepID=A0A3P3RCN2_9EURY|nr:S66 peptidase family protein [Halocatena pleomorpha]RRJ30460.1 LD-carboxypeptidase [Halocatena pleomorpha]